MLRDNGGVPNIRKCSDEEDMEGYQVNVSSSQLEDVTLRRSSKEEIKRITVVVVTQIKMV